MQKPVKAPKISKYRHLQVETRNCPGVQLPPKGFRLLSNMVNRGRDCSEGGEGDSRLGHFPTLRGAIQGGGGGACGVRASSLRSKLQQLLTPLDTFIIPSLQAVTFELLLSRHA